MDTRYRLPCEVTITTGSERLRPDDRPRTSSVAWNFGGNPRPDHQDQNRLTHLPRRVGRQLRYKSRITALCSAGSECLESSIFMARFVLQTPAPKATLRFGLGNRVSGRKDESAPRDPSPNGDYQGRRGAQYNASINIKYGPPRICDMAHQLT